mgnify:CR=1 FL=1
MEDFLIIGGGIAGISAAAQLSQLGSVIVLEMEDALGYHASGRSAAMFEENYGNPAVVELSRASAAHHRENGYLSPRGFMLIGGPGEEKGFARDRAELDLHEIPADDALARVPILRPERVTMAAIHEDAMDLD